MTSYSGEQTAAVTMPAQARPVRAVGEATASLPDHVRKHGRTCWWDVAECRWVCGG
jgi:hypothetical protein